MTSKTIMIGFVALAFVAGSIMTGTMASAEKGGVGDNLIVDALNNIATAISGIEPDVTVDPTPVTVNVDPTPITINAPQGEKGEKGDKGDTGAKGDTGDKGDQGVSGSNIVFGKLTPTATCLSPSNGWCPNGVIQKFLINGIQPIPDDSVVVINGFNANVNTEVTCWVSSVRSGLNDFIINCDSPVPASAQLYYAIISP
jgi:hypothetical protein